MLRPRIIPCLLVQNSGLVKTVRFSDPKYVGDPINAVKIFNEKEVDELVVLDIDATVQGREPDYALIASMAAECRMPLCYGGGIKTVGQVERIVSLGVEKVALSSAAIEDPKLLTKASDRVGCQSIVVVLDVKKTGFFKRHELFTHNGKRGWGLSPVEFARKAEELGAGEILVNAIDRDGAMNGYDLELAKQIRDAVGIPLSVVGGAGGLADIHALFRSCGVIGAAAGSMFVFKGKYRAVLIQYPSHSERDELCAAATKVNFS
ncbi:MAG: imidazole glycerol phosphate synthase subunit HisF [Sedimenticola thiotaurini]|uniref:imidazole glycerol-phosphate synthase n=1 Tax=Sedimenticola thiotaurini TaxID=1543721 RepID=A0A558DAP5_9GAMM|nr:MAG: imidazole glycerol phosphate synthase subunit HisF [Sedimenticola thiotaurini]